MRPLAPLAALLIALAACSSDTTSPFKPGSDVSGLWTVQTVNGDALPVIVQQTGADTEELLARTYGITQTSATAGTFTQTETLRFTQSGKVSTISGSNTGTYVVRNDSLVFSYQGTAATDVAAWDGHDKLTLVDGPNVSVLTR